MLLAIDLDTEFDLWTVEVEDVRSDRVLTPEFVAEFLVAQVRVEHFLRRAHLLAECSNSVDIVAIIVAIWPGHSLLFTILRALPRTPIPTLPPPKEQEGRALSAYPAHAVACSPAHSVAWPRESKLLPMSEFPTSPEGLKKEIQAQIDALDEIILRKGMVIDPKDDNVPPYAATELKEIAVDLAKYWETLDKEAAQKLKDRLQSLLNQI